MMNKLRTQFSILALAFMCFLALGSTDGEASKSWDEKDNSNMAYIMMEDFVKRQLKSPYSAKFPGVLDGRAEHIISLGKGKYMISSYVDAQNSFGAMIRTPFSGEIQQVSEKEWQLISLKLQE